MIQHSAHRADQQHTQQHGGDHTAEALPVVTIRVRLSRAVAETLARALNKQLRLPHDRDLLVSFSGLSHHEQRCEIEVAALLGATSSDATEAIGLPPTATCAVVHDVERDLFHAAIDAVGDITIDQHGSVVYARLPALERLGGGRYRVT